jgi:thiamine biosynthesis lipoprotein
LTLKRILRKRFGALLAAVLLTELLSACSLGGNRMYTSQLFAMNTIMELEVAGNEDVLADAEAMIRNLEQELSVTDDRSSVYALNESGSAEFSAEASAILEGALEVCERTGGALDVSIYPVLKAWGFTTGEYRVPSEDEIQALLKDVDYRKIQVTGDQGEVAIPSGMQIDLGSVVKGYTGTAVADYMRDQGVTSALINLGGNVQCIGTKPNSDKWKVAIKSPFEDSTTGIFGVIEAADTAIITSGGYERYFEEDGETYWHILDPETGYPAKSGLASVTIIGDDGLVCDGLSTALFVMGLDRAIELWRASSDFEAVFITETGDVYITEGISDSFSLSGEYYDASITVISN